MSLIRHVSNPDEMILTDEDIGRAYMDEGWGLKFVHELFQNFAVLFIGYSLSDPPLRYLSLALSGVVKKDSGIAVWNKWALIHEEDDNSQNKKNWERMGVIPLEYPVVHGSHRSLTKL